jgi:hypothetical protein
MMPNKAPKSRLINMEKLFSLAQNKLNVTGITAVKKKLKKL